MRGVLSGPVFAHITHRLGLKVAIADIDAKALEVLAAELGKAHGETNVLAVPTDVSRLEEVVRLRERVYEAWGEVGRRWRWRWRFALRCACGLYYAFFCQVAVLLNNAAVPDVGRSYEGLDKWKAVMDVNLFGYVVLVLTART